MQELVLVPPRWPLMLSHCPLEIQDYLSHSAFFWRAGASSLSRPFGWRFNSILMRTWRLGRENWGLHAIVWTCRKRSNKLEMLPGSMGPKARLARGRLLRH